MYQPEIARERTAACEMPGPPYYREVDQDCRRAAIVFGCFVLALATAFVVTGLLGLKAPHYSAAIDSVSGLDGSGNSTTLAEPLFNITFQIATRGFFRRDCVAPGSVVEVSYAGVPIAAGRARPSCARHGTSEGQRVVAWGTDVRVPRFALDGLAVDVRCGTPVFDVVVRMPSTTPDGDHEATLVSCTGLRPGDAAALRSPCAVSYFDAVMPVSSDVHVGGAT